MTEQRQGDVIIGEISDVNGNAAIGKDINQTNIAAPPTAEELKALTEAFAALRAEVERDAPPEVRDEAVKQADAMKEATLGPKPDVSVMAQARNWFLKHAPGLFGAVTTVIVNPIVGKVVQAAGDAVAAEYRKHFPEAAGT
jgi:hypothetical protein